MFLNSAPGEIETVALEESSNQVREPQNWFFFPSYFYWLKQAKMNHLKFFFTFAYN